jgi:hypothetical protein
VDRGVAASRGGQWVAAACVQDVRAVAYEVGSAAEGGASLKGKVASAQCVGVEMPSAKIILHGTDYSTLADRSGAYELRNLPAGEYRITVIRAGNDALELKVGLAAGQAKVVDVAMAASEPPGNLIRDPTLALRWARPTCGDGWYRVSHQGARAWQGEPVPIEGGGRSTGWRHTGRRARAGP